SAAKAASARRSADERWVCGFGSAEAGQRFGVIPGHPCRRLDQNSGGVALQGDEIVEGLDVAELCGVDQRHEDVGDACTVDRPKVEGILAMQNGLFQSALGDVVRERGVSDAQEERELRPAL